MCIKALWKQHSTRWNSSVGERIDAYELFVRICLMTTKDD